MFSAKKKIKALTNFDIAFLKKVFNFFFHEKKQERWYISLKTFILKKKRSENNIIFGRTL